ncbi:hypothetical protein [Lacinutrix jangbogonensis]|nr:hypothetical protein [Lacinutrix jangbogonensis]
MTSLSIALQNYNNGVVMIAVFALVCAILVGLLIKFMATSDRDKDEPKER